MTGEKSLRHCVNSWSEQRSFPDTVGKQEGLTCATRNLMGVCSTGVSTQIVRVYKPVRAVQSGMQTVHFQTIKDQPQPTINHSITGVLYDLYAGNFQKITWPVLDTLSSGARSTAEPVPETAVAQEQKQSASSTSRVTFNQRNTHTSYSQKFMHCFCDGMERESRD